MPAKPQALHAKLKAHALSFSEAWEDHPWEDDSVVKVGKKIFVFFGGPQSTGMSVKLPASASDALMLKCATPTGYGLGRGGWVTLAFEAPSCPPFEILRDWIGESYRAVAPKQLSASLDGGAPAPTRQSRSPGSARRH